MPAGELFELIRPGVILISILLSAWVLASARKRFGILIAFAWAVGTLFLPLVVLPIYLTVILLWQRPVRTRRLRFVLPIAYAACLLAGLGIFLNHERDTPDNCFARATQAKLREDHAAAIREYRCALAIENDPHTHKLLALELVRTGQLDEAAAEFRLAQQGGEPVACPENDLKCEEVLERIKLTSR